MRLVDTEDRGPVRHVVMRRAEKRNAMNGDLVLALGEAFEAAAVDDAVRCVVIRGDGPMFSSGMDLSSLGDLSERPEALRPFRSGVLRAWNLLEDMTKPTVCQIHGACIGGAMELALACDLRVMAEDAVCGLLEARIGLIPDVGGCSRLPAVVGLGVAKEMIMTGRVLDGREAHRVGFANRIAPADELDATTEALCGELLACAPLAVGPRQAGHGRRREAGARDDARAGGHRPDAAGRLGRLCGGHARVPRQARSRVRRELTSGVTSVMATSGAPDLCRRPRRAGPALPTGLPGRRQARDGSARGRARPCRGDAGAGDRDGDGVELRVERERRLRARGRGRLTVDRPRRGGRARREPRAAIAGPPARSAAAASACCW